METSAITKSTTSTGLTLRSPVLNGPAAGEVLVKFLASSINPIDAAVIAGVYPVKPIFNVEGEPIIGFDAVGQVLEVGEAVNSLKKGDFVVPARYGIGTWRSHAVMEAILLDKIPEPRDVAFGAILRLGATPAYFLIESSRRLIPGDWVAMNAGTSIISQLATQFAKRRGARILAVIRDRPDSSAVRQNLFGLGADKVVTESEIGQNSEMPKVRLAIDSVGGSSSSQLLGLLAPGGTFVQHGFLAGMGEAKRTGLNMQQVFFKQAQVLISRTSAEVLKLSDEERKGLFSWFVELFNRGELVLPKTQLDTIERKSSSGEEEFVHRLEEAILAMQGATIGARKKLLLWSNA